MSSSGRDVAFELDASALYDTSDDAIDGLPSMYEGVRLLGGDYLMRSAPGEGTCIRAQLPALEAPANGGGNST